MITSIPRRRTTLMLFCVAITACTASTTVRRLSPGEQARALKACSEPFPVSAFRAIHKLSFTFSGNRHSSFIGVTIADQARDRLRSVLVSTEGVTLFDAVYQKGEVTILRWMLPGDANVFGNNLFDDVRFMFFRPTAVYSEVGVQRDGRLVCRFFSTDTIAEVLLPQGNGRYELKRSDLNREPLKTLHMQGPFVDGFATTLTLHSLPKPAYSLVLELLEEEPLLISDDLFSR